MINRYSVTFSPHQCGCSIKTEYPISPVIGNIVGVAVVLDQTPSETTEARGKKMVGLSDMLSALNANQYWSRFLGKATISTDEGEVIASCPVSSDMKSLRKKMVPVDFGKPFSRLCITFEETDFLKSTDFGGADKRNLLFGYNLSVYVETRERKED